METVIFCSLLLCFFFPIIFLLIRTKASKRLPPGSFGIPLIGQSLQLLRVMRANKGEQWLQERARKYGLISKLHLFGTPTVFLHGQAANKFIYTCSDKIIACKQPAQLRRLVGEMNMMELNGEDHKHVRGAVVSFLKPESLKKFVGRIDDEIKLHFDKHWRGRKQISAMPLMKTMAFDIICSVVFGVGRGARRDTMLDLFELLMKGVSSLPINLPFTLFNKSLRGRSKLRLIFLEIINEKKEILENNEIPDHPDLITSFLLNARDNTASPLLSDDVIVDNCIDIMLAGYDTTAILTIFLIKLLAENPDVYRNVLNEHEEIARGKAYEDRLTWEDLAKMKYTWRVATETLRMNPPVFFTFRKVVEEFEFGGYVIPKGWRVMWAGCMTHLDESIFADPLKFDPSRFENQGKIAPYSFIAFGGGPRICPGYEFARIETLTLMHYLVTGFELKLCFKENPFGRTPMPNFNNGLPIDIKLRNPTNQVPE